MFAATVAYALPEGSTTLIDRIAEPSPKADDGLDRIHVHFGAAHGDAPAFRRHLRRFAETLAAEAAVLKVRLHLPEVYGDAHVAHASAFAVSGVYT